jgi:hypothetical protein
MFVLRHLPISLLFVLVLLSFGCGAKTGLDAPDAEMDATNVPDASDAGIDVPCVEIPLDGGPIDLPLSTEAEVGRADVLFLIDTTASMQDEIDRIRDQIRDRLAPAIERTLRDTRIGVATFADFPVEPFGDPDAGDVPFRLLSQMTDDLARIQAAVSSIDLGNGRDEAESQVEALYQVATGEGLGSWVAPSFGCPLGGLGYPCFREDALPVVLLFTDAPFHEGEGGRLPYSRLTPRPHVYSEAVAELNALGIKVMCFNSGDSGAGATLTDLRNIAMDTGAIGLDGQPLVFDVGRRGENLGTEVVSAIETFAAAIEFDVDTLLLDPDPRDGIDPRDFVDAVLAIRAIPADGVASIEREAGVFRGVVSGTDLLFQLRLRNDAIVPGPTARRFRLEIIFRGDGRTRLDRRIIDIVIPGADGSGCDAPT